jgi:hypothetical protein
MQAKSDEIVRYVIGYLDSSKKQFEKTRQDSVFYIRGEFGNHLPCLIRSPCLPAPG